MEGFLRYRFRGLIFGGGLYTEGLIFGIFTVSTFTERMSLKEKGGISARQPSVPSLNFYKTLTDL